MVLQVLDVRFPIYFVRLVGLPLALFQSPIDSIR